MMQHEKHEWTLSAFRAGKHSVDCLTNSEHSATSTIIHQEGRVFVRLAYWRAGELKEHFLEIPDSE